MTVLVDANVLCEPTKPDPNSEVVEWLIRNEQELAVNPVILGEVRFGILVLPPGNRRSKLENWFNDVIRIIHCVDWDAETGLSWADLLARLRSSGRPMPVKDSFIAATALAYSMPLATLNLQDFESCGINLIDPRHD